MDTVNGDRHQSVKSASGSEALLVVIKYRRGRVAGRAGRAARAAVAGREGGVGRVGAEGGLSAVIPPRAATPVPRRLTLARRGPW